jgi:DNA polymerase-1
MRGFAHFSGNKLLCGGYGHPEYDDRLMATLQNVLESSPDDPVCSSRFDEVGEGTFDIHTFVADELNIHRKKGKGINFGIVYGMGKRKLARQLGWDASEAQTYLQKYYDKFPEILELQTAIKSRLRERGFIFDPFGRRYNLTPDRAYVGLNRLIQGWAASVCKVGYIRVCELFEKPAFGAGSPDPIMRRPSKSGARVLKVVHDEFVSEVARELDTPALDIGVRTCMTAFTSLNVPLGTSSERSLRSWDETQPI